MPTAAPAVSGSTSPTAYTQLIIPNTTESHYDVPAKTSTESHYDVPTATTESQYDVPTTSGPSINPYIPVTLPVSLSELGSHVANCHTDNNASFGEQYKVRHKLCILAACSH